MLTIEQARELTPDALREWEWKLVSPTTGYEYCVACGNTRLPNQGKHLDKCWLANLLPKGEASR